MAGSKPAPRPRNVGGTLAPIAVFWIVGTLVGSDSLALVWVATAAAVAATIGVASGWLKTAWLSVASVLAALAFTETALDVFDLGGGGGGGATYVGHSFGEFYSDDVEALGYRPRPSQSLAASRYQTSGDAVYEVTYTIGADQLRVTPDGHAGRKAGTIPFFGGSFVFGEGLEDTETLPAQFAKAAGYRFEVLNYGLPGYGPHQALRAIELGLPDANSHYPITHVVYELIEAHLDRVVGETSWDPHGPRYELDRDTKARYTGPFIGRDDWLRLGVRKSEIFDRLRPLFAGPLDSKIAITLAVLTRFRDLVRREYGADSSIVLWGTSELAEELAAGLTTRGFEVIRVSEILEDPDAERNVIHVHDRHPSALANQQIAEVLARRPWARRP